MRDTGRGEYYQASLTSTDKVILPAGNRRRNITVYGAGNAGSIALRFGAPAIVGTDISLPGQTALQQFPREAVGSLIDQELHGISGTTANVVIIVVSDP